MGFRRLLSVGGCVLFVVSCGLWVVIGVGSDISHRLFIGWVENPDIYCWVSPPPVQPAYQPFFCSQRNPTK
jgi:hypothetical protein